MLHWYSDVRMSAWVPQILTIFILVGWYRPTPSSTIISTSYPKFSYAVDPYQSQVDCGDKAYEDTFQKSPETSGVCVSPSNLFYILVALVLYTDA